VAKFYFFKGQFIEIFDYLRRFNVNIAFISCKNANYALSFYNLFEFQQNLLVNFAK